MNYPETDKFKILGPSYLPHEYKYTNTHLSYAKSHNRDLTYETIKKAEKYMNAKCGVAGCKRKLDEHEIVLTIGVKSEREIEDYTKVEGLKEYILSINERAIQEGFNGYSFRRI